MGRFGNDVMAGGADSDTMFGELASDLMQGDGSIGVTAVEAPFLSHAVGVDRCGFGIPTRIRRCTSTSPNSRAMPTTTSRATATTT